MESSNHLTPSPSEQQLQTQTQPQAIEAKKELAHEQHQQQPESAESQPQSSTTNIVATTMAPSITTCSTNSTTSISTSTTTTTITTQPAETATTTTTTLQVHQIQTKQQTKVLARSLPPMPQAQPLALTTTTATTSSGPTALVIIPQNCTVSGSLNTKTIGMGQSHLSIPVNAQTKPIQLTTPVAVTTATTAPMTAHQQSTTTSTIIQQAAATQSTTGSSRPPSTLPVMPITSTPMVTTLKTEPNKYSCSLLDNGIRCDRVAGNASFSARIQKLAVTKKMNFILDPAARHAYICDHHKAIITAARKSASLARENNKTNARDYRHNNINNKNTAKNVNPQMNSNFGNELASRKAIQHPINLQMMNNQNVLINNHGHPGMINNQVLIRPGPNQVAYAHYQTAALHQNQIQPMDVTLMSSSFDMAGGDTMTPRAGGAISGSGSSSVGIDVDLQQLQVNTLRRYKRHFRVPTRPGLNKMQLAESLKSHFKSMPIIEKEAITYFVYIVKCYRNKLDHNPKAD